MVNTVAETNDYIVIEKPAGLLVHQAPGHTGPTLVDELSEKYPALKTVGDNPARPGLVHRLDKDASGLMVVAKTQAMFNDLKQQFQNRSVNKEYITLVHGVLTPTQEHDVITKPIGRAHGRLARMAAHSQSLDSAKEAKTEYWVIKRLRHHTLLRIKIHTGRTHQIRVHMFSLGYPLVGDKIYIQKRVKPAKNIERLFLHASKLGFRDLDGQYHEYESLLPEELKLFYETLH